MTEEQEKAVATFRQQYPQYKSSELQIEIREETGSILIRPVADPAFSVRYYMVERLTEKEGL